ncbi:hypothetical protein [Streptomyces sp. TRM49041]
MAGAVTGPESPASAGRAADVARPDWSVSRVRSVPPVLLVLPVPSARS